MNITPTPKKNRALAARWREVQQLAEVYKETYDPLLREELAGLLWMTMVAEAQIIAHKRRASFHLPQENREVSEDAVASLLGKGMTVLLEKHKPEGEAKLRTYLAGAIHKKITDYFRDSARRNGWRQSPVDRRGETLKPESPPAPWPSDFGSAPQDPDALPAPEAQIGIQSELGMSWFMKGARQVLDETTEMPVLLCYLSWMSRSEGATQLGIPENLYKSRLEGLIAKLAKRFNSDFATEPGAEASSEQQPAK